MENKKPPLPSLSSDTRGVIKAFADLVAVVEDACRQIGEPNVSASYALIIAVIGDRQVTPGVIKEIGLSAKSPTTIGIELAKKGLVTRTLRDGGGRCYLVSLTERGLNICRAVRRATRGLPAAYQGGGGGDLLAMREAEARSLSVSQETF